jgi:hypothetical protein
MGSWRAGCAVDQVAQQLRRRAAVVVVPAVPTGMFSSASIESTWYCGLCTTML